MKSSVEVTCQIDALTREIDSLERSLPTVADRGTLDDLIAAETELSARKSALVRLQARLETVRQEEHRQREQAKREALERERDEAKEQHDALTADFEAVMEPLEQDVLDALDQLDQIAVKRWHESVRHSNAAFELRGHTQDFGGSQLSALGWFDKGTENARSNVRRVLFELYAARHKMPGGLQLDGQEAAALTAHRSFMAGAANTGASSSAPQPVVLDVPRPAAPTADPNTASFAADLLGLQLDK